MKARIFSIAAALFIAGCSRTPVPSYPSYQPNPSFNPVVVMSTFRADVAVPALKG